MHTDQLQHLQALSGRKGVADLLPEWLQFWHWGWTDVRKHNTIPDDDLALFVTGSLSKWLAGQGIAVVKSDEGGTDWWRLQAIDGSDLPDWWDLETDDYMGGLISAATARLEEMQDKEMA